MRSLLIYIAVVVAISATFSSCEEEKHYYVKNVGDGESTPTMCTYDVNTFISDSGYTKYYIKTPLWNMYDEAKDPHWTFPQGVELEQYNTRQDIEATLRCDSARYLTQRRLWQLDGRVVMVNVNRDTFLTNQVFWDQSRRKIYSDSFVHIVKSDRVIEGYGFDSNESMTAYKVTKPTGIFPVDRQDKDKAPATVSQDDEPVDEEYADEPRRARAPRRASEREAQSGLILYNDPIHR